MLMALRQPVTDSLAIESLCRVIPVRSCAAIGQVCREGLTVVKIPREEGVVNSIFRRNFKIDLPYYVNILPGSIEIIVPAGRFNDKKVRRKPELSETYP